MRKLLAIVVKEWLVLSRDRAGLLILFALPMFLVLFMCITQHDNSDDSLRLLIANYDTGKVGRELISELKKSDLEIERVSLRKKNALQAAKDKILRGEYRALVVLPRSLTYRTENRLKNLAKRNRDQIVYHPIKIKVYFDPAMRKDMADSIKLSLDNIFAAVRADSTETFIREAIRLDKGKAFFDWYKIKAQYHQATTLPSSSQQNVPAWTLFGMFFIVIPLAGQMVRERFDGTGHRLKLVPTSAALLRLGRIIAYVLLNMLQLGAMLMVGLFVLPHVGVPAFKLAGQLPLIVLIGFCASLAANGYGMFIGSLCRSLQQATTIGPFTVVILASISGIFIPIYLMSEQMQMLSQFSPLYWAQASYLEVLVRHNGLPEIANNLFKLVAFFIVMLVVSRR